MDRQTHRKVFKGGTPRVDLKVCAFNLQLTDCNNNSAKLELATVVVGLSYRGVKVSLSSPAPTLQVHAGLLLLPLLHTTNIFQFQYYYSLCIMLCYCLAQHQSQYCCTPLISTRNPK